MAASRIFTGDFFADPLLVVLSNRNAAGVIPYLNSSRILRILPSLKLSDRIKGVDSFQPVKKSAWASQAPVFP